MSVHASDVAWEVKAALDASGLVGEAEFVSNTPNPDAGFPNRDGSYEYVCQARDCMRGFRITVEAVSFEEVDRLAHPEQYEWLME